MDRLVNIISNQYICMLFLAIGLASLILALLTEKRIRFSIAGLIFTILFFVSSNYQHDVSIFAILFFVLGILLLALEVVIPGFGLPGISGIICLVIGFYMITGELLESVMYLSISIIISAITIIYVFKNGISHKKFQNLILHGSNNDSATMKEKQESYRRLLGKKGVTATTLRPSGIVIIDGKRYSALTEGEFVEKDKEIQIIHVDHFKIIVKEK